jgi:hypothetical protein
LVEEEACFLAAADVGFKEESMFQERDRLLDGLAAQDHAIG